MNNLNNENSDSVWDLVELIDELNYKKLEIMDEGSSKAKIWQKIEPHVRTTACGDLKEVAAGIVSVPEIRVSPIKKSEIKEVVMEYVESVRMKSYKFFLFKKSFWAAATLLAVLFFNFYPKMPFFPSASAQKNTYVQVEQGSVEVTRDDKVFEVFDFMLLSEGDVIHVMDGSLAQVYFMDDSRMAMYPGSEVAIRKLHRDEANEASTEVEVLLQNGKIWAQVINLTSDDDYFSVLTTEGELRIERAADLNISFDGEIVKAQVAKYLASFMTPDASGMLGEGTQLTIYNGEFSIDESAEIGDTWSEYNSVQSKEHLLSVTEYYITESADKAHLLSQDPLHVLKQFKKSAYEAVGFATTLGIEDAKDAILEAEQLVNDGKNEEAEVKIVEYLSIVEEISGQESGTSTVSQHIDQATKEMSVKIPTNSNLSVIQQALDVAEEGASASEGDRNVKKINNASNKLNTVSELIAAGSYSDALDKLEDYKDEVFSVAMEITEVPQEERGEVVSEFLDQKVENLQLLKIIAGQLDALDGVVDPQLKEELSETKQQVIFEINALIVSLKERAIGTISDFLSQVQADETMQVQVLNSLKQNISDYDLIKKINDLEEVYYSDGELIFLLSE
ncbi:hypothetical protein COZ35_02185 [Candidatus Peregrinibacteria bacterium CG_4_10_14_3_um_filter_44_21]|nr:MAG: hypothetical protein COZ35_02185 [Candidatus Peregrinibacteria bacterium CG_4_10_14_3_um_filter_44_21]